MGSSGGTSRIMVSHVADAQAGSDLSELFARWKTQPEWIHAVAYQCGVRNYYADPAQLGSDRWAALIGAWESERQGCLVVDAGTAMTVDALTDTGEFLGGIITPGIDLMQQILMRDIVSLKSAEEILRLPRQHRGCHMQRRGACNGRRHRADGRDARRYPGSRA